MFIVGAVIFTVFLIGDSSEVKTNEKVNDEIACKAKFNLILPDEFNKYVVKKK